MKKYLLFLGVLFWAGLSAQPIITNNIIPNAGDSIHYTRASQTDPLDMINGENQTWDFSGLSVHPTAPDYYFVFSNPGDTPYGDQFPSSFLSANTPDTNYVYYELNDNVLELKGATAEVPNFGTAFSDYTNNETEVVFPIEYENTWSDEFSGTNTAGGFSVIFNGTIDGEVDGFGTLILPNGTYDNVVRTREERFYQITGAPAETSTLWRYVSPDISLWLLSIEVFENGGEPQIFYASNPDIINASEELAVIETFCVSPLPISRGADLAITGSADFHTVRLLDLFGKQYLVNADFQGSFITIPSSLSAGIYFLVLETTNKITTKKIIIQ